MIEKRKFSLSKLPKFLGEGGGEQSTQVRNKFVGSNVGKRDHVSILDNAFSKHVYVIEQYYFEKLKSVLQTTE